MDTENKQESAQEAVSPSVPTPVFTEPSAAQPTSAVDVDALVAKVVAALEPTIDRKVQSVKDKRIDQLERRVGRADLEDLGVQLTPEQELKLRIRDLEARQVQQPSLASGGPDSAPGNKFDVAAFAKEHGMDLNHPDLAGIVTTPHRGPEDLKIDMLEWKLNQSSKVPDASAAPALSGGGVLPPEKKTDAQIKAEVLGITGDPFSRSELERRAQKGDGGPLAK